MPKNSGTQRWGRILAAFGTLVLVGCADLRLYSPSLDEQGKKAQKAWTDVDLAGLVKAERERSAALLKAEVAYLESQPLLSRDVKLYGLVVGESEAPKGGVLPPGLKQRVASGFQEVAGDGKIYDALKLARAREERAQRQYDTGATELKRIGLEAPSCKVVLSGKSDELGTDLQAPFRGIAKGALVLLKEACRPSADSVPEERESDPNAVRKLLKCTDMTGDALASCVKTMPRLQAELEMLYALEAAREAERSAKLNERNEVRVASANYKKLANSAEGQEAEPSDSPTGCDVKKPAAPADAASGAAATAEAVPSSAASVAADGPNRTKLAASLKRLKCTIAKLGDADDKFSLKLLSEERQTAIDETLDALLSPKTAGAAGETDKDRAGRALQRLADTADAWSKAKASAADVLQRPLVAQQEIEQLQQQALNRAIAMDVAEINLQRLRVQLTERQADHYKAAARALSNVTLGDGGIEALFIGSPPAPANTRARVMEGVAHYGYAIGNLQGQYQGVTLQQQALVTTRQLDLAENSLSQWDFLIHTHVDLVAEWAALGVKEDTISRGINALLLLWIGYGTNHL
jgi:hypothetical protein